MSIPGINRPLGYVEIQRSWIGDLNPSVAAEMLLSASREANDLKVGEGDTMIVVEDRIEKVTDGAGVVHNNRYIGFAPSVPRTAAPLDPRDMNPQ